MRERRRVRTLGLMQVLRYLPLGALAVLLTLFVLRNGISTVTSLTERFESRPWLTAGAFMGLFLLKSMSFGLPFAVLYLGVGSIFPLGWALVINTCGIAVNMQVPYLLGRYAGTTLVEKIVGKFPRLEKLEAFSRHSSFLFAFIVKFIGKIPHEITNALLGSLCVPYPAYMVGGLLGLLPTMVATTVAGTSLAHPGSPRFLVAVFMVVLLTVISFVLYKRQVDSNSP